MISVEEWRRLPLPGDYKEPVLMELLKHFPNISPQLRSLIKPIEESEALHTNLKDTQKATHTLSSFGKRDIFV